MKRSLLAALTSALAAVAHAQTAPLPASAAEVFATVDAAPPAPAVEQDADGAGNHDRSDRAPKDPSAWYSQRLFVDADGDGAGAGTAVSLCTGGALPAGHAASASDCAPADPGAWRVFAYTDRDADGAGRTVPEVGTRCVGATDPAGYTNVARGLDCDADADGDGVGATPRTIFCVADVEPVGYSRFGWDVDDANASLDWDGSDEELLLHLL